jgi:hypothetical protein
MATKAPTKRRPVDLNMLFEDPLLYKNVKKVQFATQIVGEVFERITASTVGSRFERLSPDPNADVRPDLVSLCGEDYIESKSTQWRFKVTVPQLKNYRFLVRDNAVLKQRCSVNYMLWTYGDKTLRLVEHGKTVGGVVSMLSENVKSVHIIHWSIVFAMMQSLPANITHKKYPCWKTSIARGECFEVMQFGEPFLKRLRADPSEVLSNELSLDPAQYDLRPNHSHKKVSFKFLNKEWNTSRFMVHKFTPKEDYLPFPELSEICDAIPI